MIKNTADYEESEKIAIDAGKDALAKAPWLKYRVVKHTEGFFAELRYNNEVYPNHYSVHCVDGVGTKLFLAAWSGSYRKAAIDGVAMNANDMATLMRAMPDSINIYNACQTGVEKKHMGEIMEGFVEALEKISDPNAEFDVNIGKIETASLDEMISLGIPDRGLDFGIVMTGFIRKEHVPKLDPKPGHYIVGVSSTGMHSNGYTSARHVLLHPVVEPRAEWKNQYTGDLYLGSKPPVLEGKTVLEAMQEPTALYMAEAILNGRYFDNPDIYGVNITGNGLHNFNRAGHDVKFVIDHPMPLLPIHKLLIEKSGWDPHKSYVKQNNGMGFAYITPTLDIAENIVDFINRRGDNTAQVVGEVAAGNGEPITMLTKPYEGKEPLYFKGYAK